MTTAATSNANAALPTDATNLLKYNTTIIQVVSKNYQHVISNVNLGTSSNTVTVTQDDQVQDSFHDKYATRTCSKEITIQTSNSCVEKENDSGSMKSKSESKSNQISLQNLTEGYALQCPTDLGRCTNYAFNVITTVVGQETRTRQPISLQITSSRPQNPSDTIFITYDDEPNIQNQNNKDVAYKCTKFVSIRTFSFCSTLQGSQSDGIGTRDEQNIKPSTPFTPTATTNDTIGNYTNEQFQCWEYPQSEEVDGFCAKVSFQVTVSDGPLHTITQHFNCNSNEYYPSRKERSASEKLIWISVTAITNIIFVPLVFRREVLLKRHLSFEAILTLFTLMSSFFYHFCDSMDYEDLGPWSTLTNGFFLGKGMWHRLDNIGAILCFIVLLIHFTNYKNNVYAQINKFVALWIVILAQNKHPFDLRYTVYPIVFQVLILIVKFSFVDGFQLPTIHVYYAKRSIAWQTAAFFFFALGLNEEEDPYRLYHGLWHTFSGIASVYHWQVIVSHREKLGKGLPFFKSNTLSTKIP